MTISEVEKLILEHFDLEWIWTFSVGEESGAEASEYALFNDPFQDKSICVSYYKNGVNSGIVWDVEFEGYPAEDEENFRKLIDLPAKNND